MKHFLHALTPFFPLISALLSMIVAQVLKSVYSFGVQGELDIKKWFSSGGMPSSHSAMVSALSTAVGLKEGWTSSIFCLSVVFSLIVLYDASGVRQQVGKHSVALNRLLSDSFERGSFQFQEIKEFLGHTPLEVAAGVCLGIAVAFTLYN